ncbi:hypothetical protein LSH36_9g16023 [Paralvinella palmiformis]|uniref:Uncharacterized protein n=1 Tax=Paralvinella palmiformis TaxID=53620 RepID=A0AAD9KEE6_9ANNE|nr:hypothetical protein LSH36_9g16023 [Paralvinella palmiformis]
MRRKSHLLLIFGGVVFLVYYKWKSTPVDQELVPDEINVDFGPEVELEAVDQQTDDFENLYYQGGGTNDTVADGDLNVEIGDQVDLAVDNVDAGDQQQQEAGYVGHAEDEQLHLDIGQDQAGAQQPVIQQLAQEGQQLQNVQMVNGVQQVVNDQQLAQQQEQQQQLQGDQPVGQLEGQVQANEQLQADPQQIQNAEPAVQRVVQEVQPVQPQQQLPL